MAILNDGCSLFPGFPNCPHCQLRGSHFVQQQLSTDKTVDVPLLPGSRPCRPVAISRQPPAHVIAVSHVKVILGPTVTQPVWLGVRHPSGTRDQFFFFKSTSIFRHLRVCWCAAASLTRRWVCSTQSLLCFASTVSLGSKSQVTLRLTVGLSVSQSVSQYVLMLSPFQLSWPDVC
jgi:hypothetical protein